MWSAHLFQVTTGQVGPRLNYQKMSWSVSLNESEEMKFELKKSDLPKLNLNYWLAPWWAGVVVMWNGTPIVAGPITSRPYETYDAVYIDCSGIRSVLAKRFVTQNITDDRLLAKSTVSFKGFSLGTIAKKAVQQAQQKPGGALPIRYPMADEAINTFNTLKATLPACRYEDSDNCYWNAKVQGNKIGESFIRYKGQVIYEADHERNYKGYNLQNINCDAVLTKLSNVRGGPDIMFKPKALDDNNIVFDMIYGSEDDPRLPQNNNDIVWDITPEQAQVVNMQVVMTGTHQTSRVYGIGAGQDFAKIMRFATNLDAVGKGFPFLESYISAGENTNPSVVKAHATADLKRNSNMLQEIQFTVRADGTEPITKFYPGDIVTLYVKNIIGIPDGAHEAILLNMNNDGSSNVRLSLQTLKQFMIKETTEDENESVL